MSYIFGNEYLFIPIFGFAVFTFMYTSSDRIINFLRDKSLASRDEVLQTLDSMFVEVNPRRVTTLILLSSYGLGVLLFLAVWPNIIPGLILGCGATVLGWNLPRLFVRSLWESRCTRLTNQMVDGLTVMANGIKAGLSITQSMERVVDNMTGPLPQEFRLVLNKIRLGMSVEEALNEFGDRIPRQDVQMFVTSINILKETGGNLAETFSTIVTVVRERQKVEKKIQALTAQGTMQAIIITLVPFVLLGVFLLIDPGYVMPLFTRPLGWFALVLMISLQVIGGVIMKKIVTIKV
jgi:tight adherence protein B